MNSRIPFSVGLLAVHNNTVDEEDVAHELYFVDKGTSGSPTANHEERFK